MIKFFSIAKLMILLLLSLCSSSSIGFASAADADDLVTKICSKSRNPSFCFQFFNADHGSTLPVLCIKAIDKARSNAGVTYKLINSLVKGTTDPALKETYKTCLENYDDAIFNLGEARKSLKDPQGMNIRTSAAMTDVDTCEDGFGASPVKPPTLKTDAENLKDICSIVLVISNLL